MAIATHRTSGRALEKGRDSYTEGIPDKAEMIRASGIPHEVIMVVHREAVDRMPENFFHIVSLGFPLATRSLCAWSGMVGGAEASVRSRAAHDWRTTEGALG